MGDDQGKVVTARQSKRLKGLEEFEKPEFVGRMARADLRHGNPSLCLYNFCATFRPRHTLDLPRSSESADRIGYAFDEHLGRLGKSQ